MENQPMTKQDWQRIYNKKYREANREAILAKKAEYRKIMYQCSCGETVVRNNLARHLKQKKHLQLLQDQEVIKEEEVIYLNTMEEIDIKIKKKLFKKNPVKSRFWKSRRKRLVSSSVF